MKIVKKKHPAPAEPKTRREGGVLPETPKTSLQDQILRIYTDGGARGNPRPAAFGVMFLDGQDNVLYLHSEYLGVKTNNQAEMVAVRHALEKAGSYTRGEVHLHSDSKNAICWLNGDYRVRHPNIRPIFQAIQTCLRENGFSKLCFLHVRRDHLQIMICDRELNDCLDNKAGERKPWKVAS